MKWVTSRDVRVEGVACPWLITRFIDDDAEFGFVPPDEVLTVAAREQGLAFGVQGAPYAAADGRSTFDALIAQHGIVAPGLDALAAIIRAASGLQTDGTPPEAAGLRAIAEGFALATESDIEREQYQWPLYDALLAWCAMRDER
ncbi:MAG TPA: chromate resistance protein ChrB domain-containing protein [Dehalococcoidia bacterium]|jgi:hypothetical protein|nr:chromate resistance protein ChrB domain-containing protein [Dehalococcoidia bacterium]